MITILSQDKHLLIETTKIALFEFINLNDKTKYRIVSVNDKLVDDVLGIYSTKEKAEKVFNDIVAYKRMRELIAMIGIDRYAFIHPKGEDPESIPMIFEMPKDEEV